MLGFLQAVYTLEGAETGAQVAEEAKNAEVAAAIAIVASIAGSEFNLREPRHAPQSASASVRCVKEAGEGRPDCIRAGLCE